MSSVAIQAATQAFIGTSGAVIAAHIGDSVNVALLNNTAFRQALKNISIPKIGTQSIVYGSAPISQAICNSTVPAAFISFGASISRDRVYMFPKHTPFQQTFMHTGFRRYALWSLGKDVSLFVVGPKIQTALEDSKIPRSILLSSVCAALLSSSCHAIATYQFKPLDSSTLFKIGLARFPRNLGTSLFMLSSLEGVKSFTKRSVEKHPI